MIKSLGRASAPDQEIYFLFLSLLSLSHFVHTTMVRIHPTWQNVLQQEFEAPYFQQLSSFVREAYRVHTCYPPVRKCFGLLIFVLFRKLKW